MEYLNIEKLVQLKKYGFEFPTTAFCIVVDNGGEFIKLLPYSKDVKYLSYVTVYPVITVEEALHCLPPTIYNKYKLEINVANKIISYRMEGDCLIGFKYTEHLIDAIYSALIWVYSRHINILGVQE